MGGLESISLPLVWGVVTSVLGCLLPAGHALGVINIPEKVMRAWIVSGCVARGWTISEGTEVSLWAAVVSIYVAGAAVGSTAASKIADRIGRKSALLVTQILAAISCGLFLTCYAAEYVEILLLGRLVAGLSAGMATVIGSLYLSEVCPSSLKGVFSALVPLGFTVGMLIAYLAGLPQALGGPDLWPFLLSMPVVYVVLGVVVLPFAPESPSYCCTILQDEPKALAALTRLRGGGIVAVEAELDVLRAAAKQVSQDGSWTLGQIWQDKKLRKLLIFVFLLNAGQQLSGVNAVFYYSTLVFRSAGLDSFQSSVATLCIFVANVIMSVSALPLLRYFRRRVLLLVSLVGIMGCQVALVASLSVVSQATVTPSPDQLSSSTVLPTTALLSTTALPPFSAHSISSSSRNISLAIPLEDLPVGMPEPFVNEAPYDAARGDYSNQTSSKLQDEESPTDGSATAAGAVAMAAMILFVFLYGGGLGPIPYCYAAETFPCGPRGLAVTVGGMANWGGNFFVGLCFPLIQQYLKHYSFLVFAAITLTLLVVTLWQLPEPRQESASRNYIQENSTAENREETSILSEPTPPIRINHN